MFAFTFIKKKNKKVTYWSFKNKSIPSSCRCLCESYLSRFVTSIILKGIIIASTELAELLLKGHKQPLKPFNLLAYTLKLSGSDIRLENQAPSFVFLMVKVPVSRVAASEPFCPHRNPGRLLSRG